MRPVAIVLLLIASQALSAPVPAPKPRPEPVRGFWEIDFNPLATAGRVNLRILISVRTADNQVRQLSVSQSGQVLVAPIVDAFARSFQEGDLVIGPGKTKMTIKSMKGQPVLNVDLVLTNLDQKYCPLVLRPGKR